MIKPFIHPYAYLFKSKKDRKELKEKFRDMQYGGERGWKTGRQIGRKSVKEYIRVAEQCANSGKLEMQKFCKDNELSYISIPHHEFVKYEKGPMTFREWFDQYCQKNGFDPNVNVCIIEPHAKSLERAEKKNKTSDQEMHDNIDYLRGMFVTLMTPKIAHRKNAKRDNKSLQQHAGMVMSLEFDPRTEAFKNQYWARHKDGFAGHKSAWKATAPEGEYYAGEEIIMEVKSEHESQMEIDKITRRTVLPINRQIEDAFEKFSDPSQIDENTYKQIMRLKQLSAALSHWGRMLYDKVHEDAGIDIFLSKETQKNKQAALSYNKIFEIIEEEAKDIKMHETMYASFLQHVANAKLVDKRQAQKIGLPAPATPA